MTSSIGTNESKYSTATGLSWRSARTAITPIIPNPSGIARAKISNRRRGASTATNTAQASNIAAIEAVSSVAHTLGVPGAINICRVKPNCAAKPNNTNTMVDRAGQPTAEGQKA